MGQLRWIGPYNMAMFLNQRMVEFLLQSRKHMLPKVEELKHLMDLDAFIHWCSDYFY